MQSRALIVDDDLDLRDTLKQLLEGDGYACEVAADGASALKRVENQPFDVVVCDVRMEGMNGLELLDRVKRSQPALPFILITGGGGVPQAIDAIKRGAFQYMVKPCDWHELRRLVRDALELPRAAIELVPPTTGGGDSGFAPSIALPSSMGWLPSTGLPTSDRRAAAPGCGATAPSPSSGPETSAA